MKNLLMALVAVGLVVGCGGDSAGTSVKKETKVSNTGTGASGTTGTTGTTTGTGNSGSTTVKKTEEVKTSGDANKKP